MLEITNRDWKHIRAAVRAAHNVSDQHRFRLGAVAVKSGRILSVGFNSARNKPADWIPRSAWSTHAEEACLKRLPEGTRGATLYVARVGRSGNLLLSKPCNDCMAVARNAGVARIVFTRENQVDSIILD